MRPDRLFLLDIVEAAASIVTHIAGRDEKTILGDRTARAAVLHELAVIGEAATRISDDTKARHPEIPWPEIIGFRNVVIHEYFGLSWPIIWVTATEDVPDLRRKVAIVLESEFHEPEDE